MNQYNNYYTKLKNFIIDKSVEYQHTVYDTSCHSVDDAVLASGEDRDTIVKSVCMIDNKGVLIVAIVSGNFRASTSRVAKALGIDRPRLATPEEVFVKTGYPAGGVPSFSYPAVYLIDEKVMENEFVITGGGSEFALIKIKSQDLHTINNGKVFRIRK